MVDRLGRTAVSRAALVVVASGVLMVTAAACDQSRPVDRRLPPDGTQPVNSMTQDSVMVPGAPEPAPAP